MNIAVTGINFLREAEVAGRLKQLLPAGPVLHAEEDTRSYECDGLSAYRQLPMVVALPSSEDEVRQALAACHGLKVPVVVRGAGTGLSGGALPMGDGVLLSLAKMRRILALDPVARTARVQPGVTNLAISEAAAPCGLFYAPDPSSQIACSIGGNVAENSGGVHCLKYGLTLHNVLRVRAVTVEGEVIEFGSEALDAPGLDLLALMIGSEGMLAVATEITVKLVPNLEAARVILASFDDVEKAGNAVADVIAAGVVPSGLEMMDRPAVRAVEEFVHAGYDLQAAALLLCEADGTPEEVEEGIAGMTEVLRRAGATAIRVSSSEAERQRFWAGRKAAFPAVGRISPDYYCMDGTIPRRKLGEILKFIASMEKKYDLRCPNVFHAGDGNLHPLILFDANDPDQLDRTERFAGEVLEKCVEVGGTITGEHGLGLELHLNSTPSGRRTPDYPGDVPPNHGIRITPEFSWGLGNDFDWGLYLPTATDSERKYHLGGAKLRVKWLPVRSGEGQSGWYFGINNELSRVTKTFSESRWNDEVRVIGGYRGPDWLIGVNPVFGWGLSPGFRGSPEVSLAWKAMHDVGHELALGVEYYNDIGTLANRLPRDQQGRTLYAGMEVERKTWSLNFGVGHGVTPATDNWTVKAIVGISFD